MMRTVASLLDRVRSQELDFTLVQVGDAYLDQDSRLYAVLAKELHGQSKWLVLGNEASENAEARSGKLEMIIFNPIKIVCGGGWELAPTLLAARTSQARCAKERT